MAADEVGRAFEMSSVEMQVAAAEGCGGDLEDCVGRLLDLGVRAVFYCDLFRRVSFLSPQHKSKLMCLALKSLLSTTARIVSGGVKPMAMAMSSCGWMGVLNGFALEYSCNQSLSQMSSCSARSVFRSFW